jgi:hypothetical protein
MRLFVPAGFDLDLTANNGSRVPHPLVFKGADFDLVCRATPPNG